MASSATAYGTFNPVALQPYPIETELAKMGYENSPTAAKILGDQYWLERQAHENLYGQELQAQHEQYAQQLENQLYEQNIKGLAELSKPGVAQLVASTPYYASRLLPGTDPSAVQNMIQMSNDAAAAQNFAHTGSGLAGYASGGYTTNLPTDPTHGQYSFIGTPAQIQAAARIQAAGITAAANQIKPMSASIQLPESIYGTGSTLTVPVDPRNPDAALSATRDLVGRLNAQPAQPPSDTPTPIPLVPKKIPITPGTNLQPANQVQGVKPASQQPSPRQSFIPTNTPEGQQAQVTAMKFLDNVKRTNPSAYQIIAPPGNVIPLQKMPNGTIAIIGNDGNRYAIQ
jgi:hypothetical protein